MTAPVFYDRVMETSVTSGTGDYTLIGAVPAFQSFAVVGDGNECTYSVTDNTNWEVGIGTYHAGPKSLTRTTILASSNNGNPISWAAVLKVVFLELPANLASILAGGSTGSGPVVLADEPTLVGPVINGPTTGTGVSTTAAANTLMQRGANGNAQANVFIPSYTSTATAAGTTTLTVASTQLQKFTGTTTQTIVLPVVSTLQVGHTFEVNNQSTGSLTVNSSGGNLVITVAPGAFATLSSNATTGTSAAVWDLMHYGIGATGVLPGANGGTFPATTAAQIAGADTTRNLFANLADDLRGGTFILYTLASLPAAEQTAAALDDANGRGIYIISMFDATKVWKRVYAGAVNIQWWGAFGDVTSPNVTLSITSSTKNLTAVGATFAAADVGKSICIAGAGTSGGILFTHITARVDATHVTVNDNAVVTVGALASVACATTVPLLASLGTLPTGSAPSLFPAPTYANGALGVGATLTANPIPTTTTYPVLVIDGYTPVLNDRILVTDENENLAYNGVYALTTVGTATVPYVLTRVTDFDQSAELLQSKMVPIVHGTVNAGKTQYLLTSGTVTVGTTALTFSAYGSIRYWTDQTTAVQNCINVVLALGGGQIYSPVGEYGFDSTAPLDPGAGGLEFTFASGSSWHYYEGNGNLIKNIANITKKHLWFTGFSVKGTLDLWGRQSSEPFWLDYFSTVKFRDCLWDQIASGGMDCHFLGSFWCTNGKLTNIGGGGIRCRDTPNIFVDGNFIQRDGDDAIECHTTDLVPTGYQLIRERIIVTNNILVNVSGGIRILGARSLLCSGNILRFVQNGISFGVVVTEGNVPSRDIDINHNLILDQFNAPAGVPSANSFGISWTTTNARGATITDGFVPGRYDTTASAWVYPSTWDNTLTDNAANPVSPLDGLSITHNTIRKTQPGVPAFSMYGYGTTMNDGVAYDPPITEATLLQGYGIVSFAVGLHNSKINDNIIEGRNFGISFPGATTDFDYLNVDVKNNQMFDVQGIGVFVQGGAFNVDMRIVGNDINCDPYRRGANSNLNGTYITGTGQNAPLGIDATTAKGLTIDDNKFANCCIAVYSTATVPPSMRNNLLISSLPVALGFNAGNKGIGFAPSASAAFKYKIIDADPTSATFNSVITNQLSEAAAQPSTGSWVQGAMVKNTLPALAAGVTNEGWIRLTTGTANVAGTDWANMKVAN